MPDFSILLGGIHARLLAAGDNQEQRTKILRAISDAHEAVDCSDVRGIEYMNAKGAAYRNVLHVLRNAQHPERAVEYVRDENDDDPVYEAEVERLWKIVERVLADKLD